MWRCAWISLTLKIILYKTLVLSILFYALVCCPMNYTTELKLERWQTKCLRHIAKQPTHLTHTTATEVRMLCQVHTLASSLCCARLLFWRGVLRPAFLDDEGAPPLAEPIAEPSIISERLSAARAQ